MAVSNAELRILLSMQARGQEVAAQVAKQVESMTAALDAVGRSRGVQMAAQQMQQLSTAATTTARNLAQVPAAMTRIVASGTGITQGARSIEQGYQRIVQAAREAAQAAQQAAQSARSAGQGDFLSGKQAGAQALQAAVNSAMGGISTAFKAAQQNAQASAQSITAAIMSISNAAKGAAGGVAGGLSAAMNGLKTLVGGVTGIAGQIAGIGKSTEGLRTASQNVTTLTTSLRDMLALGASIVGFQGAVALLQRGFEAVKDAAIGFNSTLENAKTAFTSLLGSGEKATAFLAQLRDMAERTSFEFPDLLKTAQQLVGVGLAAENVIPLLKDVAGAMTAAGRTSADVAGVSRALQQILTTGRVQADEMNQLSERGINGWRILGEAIQQTGESIESAIGRARKLGEAGKISANDFFNAFQQFSRAHGWREMAENAVNTFTGAVSNLKDSFSFLIADSVEPLFRTLSTGLQGLSTLLMSTPVRQFALDVAATMNDVIKSFGSAGTAFMQAFDFSRSNGAGMIQSTLDGIIAAFGGMADGMQSAGAQLMLSYAEGIMNGAGDAIQAAVDFVAEMIASFLIGNSPPPAGPLASITEGGRNVGMAWVQGLQEGVQGVGQVVQGITDAFGNVGRSVTLDGVREAFQSAAGNVMNLKAAAEDVEGALRTLDERQRAINQEQANAQNSVSQIKDYYGEQIDSLERASAALKDQNTYAERQAELIQKQNDAISQQADLRDRMALNELKAAEIAAEGDPVKRAALVAQQAQLKAREEDLQLAQREHDLSQRQAALDKQKADGKAKGSATDKTDLALAQQRIDLDREQLANARAINALTDKGKLAEIEAQRSLIERNRALRQIEEDRARAATESVKDAAEIERAQRALAALPLDEQARALKEQQEAALKPYERQLSILQQQERILQTQRQAWQGLKKDISDAIAAQKATDKAGQSGSGFAGGALNLDRQEIDMTAARRVGNSFAAGIGQGIQENLPEIIGGVIGGVLGGAAFGPLGLAAGAYFGAQVGEGIKQRVPNVTTILADAGRTFFEAFAGQWDGKGDEWISPLVRAAGMLGIAFRTTADVIAAAWEAIKVPVAAGAEFIRQNSGLAAAALTGLLVPAFSLLLSTVGAVISPIIALLAPLTPAILAVSAAAVLLKLAWDNNFGGLQQTVTAAIPAIIASLNTLGAALTMILSGDFSGGFDKLMAAFSSLGQALAPILQGVGQAIAAKVAEWGSALWEWIKEATPQAISAIGQFANSVYQSIVQNAEPFLKATLAWGKALVAWVAPMIGPAVQALGSISLAILQWVAQQIPMLTQALMKWSIIFIGWIVTDVIPQIPGALALLAQAIFAGLAAVLPVLLQFGLDMSAAIWNGLVEGLDAVAPGLGQWLITLQETLVGAWAALVEGVTAAVAAIVAAWEALPALLQGIWDGITGALQAAWDAIMAAWEAFWELMQAAWEAPGNAIADGLEALWNTLDTNTQQSLTRMVQAVGTLWQSLQTLTATVWAAIQTVISAVLTFIESLVTAWIAVQTAAWTTFSTTLQGIWDTLTAYATTAWTALTAAITAVVTAWIATITTQWNLLVTIIQGVWNTLATTLGPLVQKALDIITSTMTSWIETQKTAVTRWTELGTSLATAFMEAIRLGINAKIQEITGAVSGMAEGLTGIIDKILGRSTSKITDLSDDLQTNGKIDPTKVGGSKINISPGAGRTEVLKQWAPVLQAIEANGGPLARNIASIILAENGAGNSDLVRNSRNWFSISAVASRRQRGLQGGVDAGGRFASYDSDAQSIADFLDLIQNSPNYDMAWQNRRGSTGDFINGLIKGNYIVPEPGFPVDTWFQNTSRGAQEYDQATAGMTFGTGRSTSMRGPGSNQALSSFKLTQGQWARNMADAETICGPRLAALFAESVGRPPTPQEAKDLGMQMGVYSPGAGITAAGQFDEYATALIRQANPMSTATVQQIGVSNPAQAALAASQRLQAGAPLVGFNTPNHYFGATAYDPASQRFNTGGTGMVYGNTNPWLTAEEIARLGGGITNVIALAGQMGDAFQQAGATATTAVQGVEEPVTGTTAATQSLAQSLLGQVVPAGTATGTAIQQMSMSINPLLGEIAQGSLTTEELTGKLLEMGQSFGLTNVPVEAFQQGQISADQAMQALIASAAQVDPAFVAIQEQMTATNASAQTMAVTFAEGVGNATGQTAAAIEQMSGAVTPLIQQFDAGQLTTDQMSAALVEMAAATGETTRPFRMLQDGATTANQALAQVITDASKVSPEFAALSEEVNTSGEVTAETAKRFAELVASFRPAVQQADQVATATDTTATSMTDAVPAAQTLATTMTDTSAQSVTAMQSMESGVTSSLQSTLSSIQQMEGPAREAGNTVGKAIMEGIIEGIESMMGDLEDKLKEIEDKLKEIEDAASKAKEAGKKKGGDDKGDDKGDDSEGDSKADKAISAAESVATQTIAAMRAAADAHSPSNESRKLGWDMVEGLEVGQLEDSKYAGKAGDQVVVETLRSMRKAADAHSPSNESKALGQDLVAGLSVGQQEDMGYAAEAGADTIDETLKAMRVAADAHSPSNETYRLGEDVIGGLRKALEDANVGKIAKEVITKFLKEFDSFGGAVYEQVRTQILQVQKLVAVQEQSLLPLQQQIEAQQQKITEAHEGTYRSQLQQNALAKEQLNAEGVLLAIGRDRRANDIELRDKMAQQEAIRKGSIQTQMAEAAAQADILGLQAEITKRENDMLGQRRQARDLAQAVTAKEAELIPLKRGIRNLQQEIDDAMKGTLADQVSALRTETETAKGKLRTLQIEDDLANASERGLSQDQVNSLFDERSGIAKQADNADRQAQMAQLQRQIDTAPKRELMINAQQQLETADRAINPLRDATDDANAKIKTDEIANIQPLQDEIDLRKGALEVAGQQREFQAATMQEGILLLQNTAAIYDAMEQSQTDRIDLIKQAQAFESNYRDTVANGLELELLGMNQKYKSQSAYLGQLNKELALLQAGQKVREADLAIMEDLRKQLENLGFSFEPPKPPEAAPSTPTQPKDDPEEGTGRGGKKKEKKKKKKKSSSSDDMLIDWSPAVSGADDGASLFLDIVGAANKATVAVSRVNDAIGKRTTASADLAAGAVGDVNTELTDVDRSDPTVTIDDQYINSTYSSVNDFLGLLGTTFNPTYGLSLDRSQLDTTYTTTNDTNTRLDALGGLRTLTIGKTTLDDAFTSANNTNLKLDSLITGRSIMLNDQLVDDAVTSTGTTLTNLQSLKDGPAGTGTWNAVFGVNTTHAFNVGSIATAGATTLTNATLEDVEDIDTTGITSGDFHQSSGAFFVQSSAGMIVNGGGLTVNGNGINTTKNIEADDDIKADRIVTGSGRAAGGSVNAGQSYTVGEIGRELFVPSTDGYIINNATTERLLSIMGMRSDGIVSEQRLGSRLGTLGGGDGYGTFADPSFGSNIQSSSVTVVHKTNQYNLTINTNAPSEQIIHDFAMMQAINGDG